MCPLYGCSPMVVLPLPGPYMPHPKPGLGRKKKHTPLELLGISLETSNKSDWENTYGKGVVSRCNVPTPMPPSAPAAHSPSQHTYTPRPHNTPMCQIDGLFPQLIALGLPPPTWAPATPKARFGEEKEAYSVGAFRDFT